MGHARVTEAQLMKATLDLARLKSWRIARFPATNVRDGKHLRLGWDTRGFPDVLLVRDRLMTIEFKSDTGVLSVDQQNWSTWLGKALVEDWVIRPQLWLDGTVERILA